MAGGSARSDAGSYTAVVELLKHLINGEHVASKDDATLDNVEPATGEVVSQIAAGSAAEAHAAIDAAAAAFEGWSRTPADERARVMERLADLIEADTEPLARAESVDTGTPISVPVGKEVLGRIFNVIGDPVDELGPLDTGKPISLARRVDIPRSAANFRSFAALARSSGSASHAMPGTAIGHTLRKPRGVAGCISPWNLPLYLFSWKIAPALATGNTVVGKPSELSPTTATRLGELTVKAGFPPGVVNIVHGLGPSVGQPIVEHPSVPTISFTGGTATGSRIASACAPMFKRVGLELGGKNPFIVFADADLDRAVETAVRAGFTNQGQICLCGSRLLVEASIADEFVSRFVERVEALVPGDPLDDATTFGSLISDDHRAKVDAAVREAEALGGRVLTGGSRPSKQPSDLPARCARGAFYLPTVIDCLDPACPIEQNEIFGPVVTVQRFQDEDDALDLANGTPYGLAASLFTSDLSRAHRMAETLDFGILWINCWMLRDLRTPFGGMKQSGLGREGGEDAMRFFTEPTSVCIQFEH